MPQLRIALAQINATVGDIAGNAQLHVDWAKKAAEAGAHVVVFPEMSLTGYPVEDLTLRKTFAQGSCQAVDDLARRLVDAGCGELLVYAGYLDNDEVGPRDAAVALYGGEVVGRQFKHHLPNYGVFDEHRYFKPGQTLDVVRLHGLDIGMVICEDIWQDGGPVTALGEAGVDLVVAPNASPYERSKDDIRLPLVARRAAEARAPLVYTNLVGGQDDLVFDGDSIVVGADGSLLARAPQFVEHLLVVDLELPSGGHSAEGTFEGLSVRRRVLSSEALAPYEPLVPPVAEPLPDEAEVWSALVVGLRDYVQKNGFRSVMFGFSGGIDSAVTAALAADALGPDAVYGVSMPSAYSSSHSREDAAELARRLGCHFRTESVEDMVRVYVEQLKLTGLAEENIQARVRGMLLMSLSNQDGHLVLATGNKTELAVGYSTIYGDAVGGFAPIKDVFKTHVWELARWRNAEAEKRGEVPPIPENSITKPPSAELRPGQLDTDSLPDYPLLDDILDDYVEGDRGYADLIAAGFEAETIDRVIRMVDRAEYKRRQYPIGTKITFKAFGRDRRLPITNGWREGDQR
ncbi:NAD+ synthase (glutamine-hydrolyzing) [Amycolatopsis bartoniae]|uniref:Glutamine-dependent NAD(+) synthetase n=1 Tax=Amycolatopsis bartoniae TaxID=941986 RepID=A0A8H9MG51_9PSEU|nr:NAD+ synthase [Amycolatopsis bartoniae]MBB2938805.1 NAD+ synthase (glutamine-hydrolyzing) [Amycolatopsis bartoniae]TVS99207.1 NAD+ synthase [Amycolatopsis bartoniae]GHF89078.1 NAD+ synthase (glutamine-hydrolysing) [Amycolatopsis bartoniae]